MLPFTSWDLEHFPFLGFDVGLGASSQVSGCGDRNHVLVLTVRPGAWGPFSEDVSGPWDTEQERSHYEMWPKRRRSWLCEAVPGLVRVATTPHILVTPITWMGIQTDW